MSLTKVRTAGINVSLGTVLQIVQSTMTDRFTTASSSLVDMTGTDQDGNGSVFCCKITPSSSSNKVLVILSCSINSTDAGAGISLVRDSTEIFLGTASGSRKRYTMGGVYGGSGENNIYSNPQSSIHFLDSPNTTSEVLYKMQTMSRGSAVVSIGASTYNVDNDNTSRTPSSITLMEIRG